VAGAQDGVVSRPQLLALGLTDKVVDGWLACHRLHALHETVYALGHASVSRRGRSRAALMAAGDGAALSHVTAAVHRGYVRWKLDEIDVTVPRNGERGREGICFHRPVVFGEEDVEIVDGLRCTTVARMAVDCAAVLRPARLERVLARAEYRGELDAKEIVAVLDRISRPRGVRNLRRILGRARLDGSRVESELERTYLAAFLGSRAERPITQAWFQIGPERRCRADFYWPRRRLIVEVDGPHHRLPIFAAADASRDRELRKQGLHIERFDDLAIERDLGGVVARTLDLLHRRTT
jgi:very-short-patch-repair endonuclease